MKTFKLTSLILLATLGTIKLHAQKVYVDFNVGYALPLAGGIQDESITYEGYYNDQTGEENHSSTYKSVNSSLGKGFNFGGSVGYMFNKNLGFELGLNYTIGSAVKYEEIYNEVYVDFVGETHTNSDSYVSTASSNMFQIAPTVVLSTGFDKFNPYAKFGFVMGFGKVISEEEYSETNYPNSNMTTEYSGGLGMGFTGSFGTQYILNEKMSLFTELNFMSYSYAPKKAEVTEYTIDRVDELSSLSTSNKETEFLKEYTITDGSNSNDEPSKTTKISLPYNNIGLKFGIKFSF